MLISYSNLSMKSRVWIYQSERKISVQEKQQINEQLIHFCNNWTSQGKILQCSFKIYDWFICIFTNSESNPSGCAIDKSVTCVKNFSNLLKINFFNRQNVIFRDKGETKILPLEQFKLIASPELIVYNNMVKTKEEFELNWRTQLKNTWLNIYI